VRQAVENVTVTRFLFWNAGAAPISRADIPAADPIAIHTNGDFKILDADVVKITNPAAQVKVSRSRDRTTAVVSFDFIDYNQPVLVEVIHTGTGSKDLVLTGQVIGAGPFVEVPYHIFVSKTCVRRNRITTSAARFAADLANSRRRRLFGVGSILFSLFICAFSMLKVWRYFTVLPPQDAWEPTFFEIVIYGSVIYYLGMVGYFLLNRTPPPLFAEFEAEM
jgi:hypothetical protein